MLKMSEMIETSPYWTINRLMPITSHSMIVLLYAQVLCMVMVCSLVMELLFTLMNMLHIMVVNSLIWMNFGNVIRIKGMLAMLLLLVVDIIVMLWMIGILLVDLSILVIA